MTSLATHAGLPALRGVPKGALRTGAVLLAAALGLAACDSSSGGGTLTGIETLGSDFTKAFRQGPNDTPLDASTLSIPSTPLIEPFDP